MRYLRLYLYFLRFSFSKAMQFRLDFQFRIIMDLVYYGVNIAFFQIIFLHTDLLAGWSEAEVMVFVGIYLSVDALNMTVFANNLWWLPFFINRGDLDYYLVRPVSPLFILSLREFAANSFFNLLMALSFLTWTLFKLPEFPEPGALLILIFLLPLGAYLHYLVHLLCIIPVFWTHSAEGGHGIFYTMARFMERPDRIFNGWVRKILTTVIPFSLMASFPARLFLDGFSWDIFIHLMLTTIGFTALVLLLWRLAVSSYSSASS